MPGGGRPPALQELQDSREQLRLAIDTILAAVWSALADGSIDFVNQRISIGSNIRVSLGRRAGWGGGATIHPEDRAGFLDDWRAAVATGKPFATEARVQRVDGQHRWTLIRAMPLRDELGKIIRWYGEITDIDDRKRVEEVLKEQARLLDLTHDGVFVRDVNDAITGSSRCRPVDKEPANRHARAPRNPRPHARVILPAEAKRPPPAAPTTLPR
ncbi:MAG TPA: PAS domain-containing protein [Myxococcota bacterium]|nr:PAS domain-containing protein [Myxococcota bacterium]